MLLNLSFLIQLCLRCLNQLFSKFLRFCLATLPLAFKIFHLKEFQVQPCTVLYFQSFSADYFKVIDLSLERRKFLE